jgi:hypothetical protein
MFAAQEDNLAYGQLLQALDVEVDTSGVTERLIVEELARSWVRRQIAARLEDHAHRKVNPGNQLLLRAVRSNPTLLRTDKNLLPNASESCDPAEVDITISHASRDQTRTPVGTSADGDQKTLHLSAKFPNSLDTALRYQQQTGRDFFRALREYRKLSKKSRRHKQ